MQLEQQESFEIKGPQLEVLGEVESKLPPVVKKKPVAILVIAVAALVSVFGIGGASMKAAYNEVARSYTAVNERNQGIQQDFATQADAAANMVRLAGRVLGETDGDVTATADALAAWNANSEITPEVQYALNSKLYSTVDTLYTAAANEADSKTKDQLTVLRQTFVSAQNTIDRSAAEYNDAVQQYRRGTEMFPAPVIGALWGANDLPLYGPQ